MEYRQANLPSASNPAAHLFERLNAAGIRYGAVTNALNIPAAMAGDRDLDVLVARDDYRRFCVMAAGCGGIRSVNHKSLVSPGREDWFVPDFDQGRYVHLDVHVALRLGGSFNKAYPFWRYGDIRDWQLTPFDSCSIRIASAEDQARIALSRIAFQVDGPAFGLWQTLGGKWAKKIDPLLFPLETSGERIVSYASAGSDLRCRVRKCDGEIQVRRVDLGKLRSLVRRRCLAPPHAKVIDPVINAVKTVRYAGARALNRIWPGSTIDRRRPASGGLVVAVIAPDGMGKTTQVRRMRQLFAWKFSCATIYLGTGDGEGWKIRRLIRAAYIKRRPKVRASLLSDVRPTGAPASFKRRLGALLLSLWGMMVALERYASMRKASRMADRGFIVFCDRWPQDIQPGLMDGPTRPSEHRSPGRLRTWELALYRRMAQSQPDVSVQLVGSYATSQARKPGELAREDFDKRMALMEELRERFPGICVLDADRDIDAVSRSLFRLIWSAL